MTSVIQRQTSTSTGQFAGHEKYRSLIWWFGWEYDVYAPKPLQILQHPSLYLLCSRVPPLCRVFGERKKKNKFEIAQLGRVQYRHLLNQNKMMIWRRYYFMLYSEQGMIFDWPETDWPMVVKVSFRWRKARPWTLVAPRGGKRDVRYFEAREGGNRAKLALLPNYP